MPTSCVTCAALYRVSNLIRIFEDNAAFKYYLNDVEGEGEKAILGWVLFSCREDELYEVTGMETELMLPHGTTAKAGPWDGITTEINHRHVRSYLAGDPNMKGWRRGRRVGSARGPRRRTGVRASILAPKCSGGTIPM